jgi:D-sedoheptulose 7-phosphate isomerase
MNGKNLLMRKSLEDHAAIVHELLTNDSLSATVMAVAAVMRKSLRDGHKLIWFGNGGSAADAQHIVAELTGGMGAGNQTPLAAMTLTTNTSSITAIGNDYGFDDVFARQLAALGCEGDVAVGLSTSGNSANVLRAMAVAKAKNMVRVGMTGRSGALRSESDLCIAVPSDSTPRIQEIHILVGHVLCDLIVNGLGEPR